MLSTRLSKISGKAAATLGAVTIAIAGFFVAAPAMAQGSPVGCTDNTLNLTMAKDVTATSNGMVVHYQVRVTNNGGGTGCDITGASISFTAPATDGSATGTTTLLGSGLTFLANGTNNTCWTSIAASCPGGFTEVVNAALAYTTNVNVGVHSATAKAVQSGTRPATTDCPSGAAILHDTPTGDDACASKTLSVEVVNLQILIDSNSTNEINNSHTFTVTVNSDPGTGIFGPVSGATVTPGITGTGSLTGTGTCQTGTTDVSGHCTIIVNSPTPGVGTISASTTVSVDGVSLTRSLGDSVSGDSAKPTKTWVDANITISPDGNNPVNVNHTFTVTIMKNPGTGLVAANGEHVTFNLADSGGAASVLNAALSTCDDAGPNTNASGQCTIVFTSPTAGTTVGNAFVTLTVGGVSLTRDTDPSTVSVGAGPGGSGPATKTWHSFTAHMTTTIHDAGHNAVTSVTAGSTVHDSATVTGTNGGDPLPTGFVDFTFFDSASNCDSHSVGAGHIALDGTGVAHPSTSEGPLAAGSYAFRGHYLGDSNYPNGAVSDCEPLTVSQLTPTVVTHIHDTGHNTITSANAGDTVHDSATVSGSGATPTGNVTFSFYTNGTCNGEVADTSSTFALVSGSVDATTFTKVVAPTAASFLAHYAGDIVYSAKDGDCEPLTVSKLTSTVNTAIHNDAHATITSALPGATVHDSASVTPSAATGNVTFDFWNNANCTGTPDSTSGNFALVAGSVDATTFTKVVNPPGASFKAHYAGDSVYNPDDGDCEPLSVSKINTGTVTEIHDTAHNVVTSVNAGTSVHDKAIVTPSAATGNVTFNLYSTNNCSGQAVSSQVVALAAGSAESSAVVANATLSYQAVYAGDSTYNGSTGACEPLVVQGLQYCSPGYWKQDQHFDSYITYNPTDLFDTVFGVVAFPGKTLVEVLSTGGGGLNAYGRKAVGALLNASSLNSGLTPAQVIAKVKATITGAASVSAKNLNSYYGSANPEFTAPENCPLN